MAYFIVGVIVVLVIFWVITPLFLKSPAQPPVDTASAPGLRGEELTELRDTLLRNLKDLEFDRSMGKINEDEYAVLRAKMTAQVSKVLDQIERGADRPFAVGLESAGRAVFSSAAEVSLELEVLVARARRQALKAVSS